MAGFTLRKHMVFDWDGTEHTILDLNSNGQVLLENANDKVLKLESKVNLLSAYKAGNISAKTPSKALACAAVAMYSRPLDELTEKDRQEIQRRKHYLDWILAEGNPDLYGLLPESLDCVGRPSHRRCLATQLHLSVPLVLPLHGLF